MLRILQIADVHLGCSFSGVMDQLVRDRLHREQRDIFRRALAPARAGQVDLVLIPGDLIEHDRADLDTVRFVQAELAAVSPVPVFIAPGNHDPCVRGSYYLSLSWPGNVHVFKSTEFEGISVLDGRVTVYGIANCGAEDTRGAFRGSLAADHGLNIGIIHGSCMDKMPERFADIQCLPFTSEDIARSGFEYVAVGHYHSFVSMPSADDPRACYSGCLQGMGFDEPGEKGSLLVEIDSGVVKTTFLSSGGTEFATANIELGRVSTSEQILDALKLHAGAAKIVRVTLSGEVDPELGLNLAEIRQRASELFLYLVLDGSGLETAYDFVAIAGQDTVAGKIVREVDSRLDGLPLDSRERRVLEQARLCALRALSGREVKTS